MSAVVPQITTINPADLAPRYVWLDEDGQQVSPVHKSFPTALHFVQGWQERWRKLVERWGVPTEGTSQMFERASVPMTRSGKPPVELKKVLIEIRVVDLAPDELSVTRAMLNL